MKNILNFLEYLSFAIIMLYFFAGGFKMTIDYLIGVQ
jgi:hypothetical protein